MRSNRPLNHLAAAFEHTACIGNTPLLHVAILEPLVVVAAPARWSSCFLAEAVANRDGGFVDRKSTRLNSSHVAISYAVFCLKKKKIPMMNSSDTMCGIYCTKHARRHSDRTI